MIDARQALCRFLPPQLFERGPAVQMRQARDLCFQCPIRLECLDDAVRNGGGDMIRGGFLLLEKPGGGAKKIPIRQETRRQTVVADEEFLRVDSNVWGDGDDVHRLFAKGLECRTRLASYGRTCKDEQCKTLAAAERKSKRMKREMAE